MSTKFISCILPRAEAEFLKLATSRVTGKPTQAAQPAQPKFVDVYEEATARAQAKRLAQAPQRLQFQSSIFRPNPYSKKS